MIPHALEPAARRAWQVGDVAELTFTGGERATGVRTDRDSWSHTGQWGRGAAYDHIGGVTAVRPLVVIDPEDREQVERLRDALPVGGTLDRWQQALREFADPTPPKPDEPTGLGAVVEDSAGDKWIRAARLAHGWHRPMGTWATWSDFDAVKVLSEGVTP